jgi:hypothetical protein
MEHSLAQVYCHCKLWNIVKRRINLMPALHGTEQKWRGFSPFTYKGA